MSLLTARGVTVSYGALAVLHNASLAVAAGDRIAVVGPNGVGKSTLLKVLAGLVQPDGGMVSAAGTVGYLPQERDRRDGETAMGYLARRTGVAAAESAMTESEAIYRFLFERNVAGVFYSTLEGEVRGCNEAFARILGYESPEEVRSVSAVAFYAEPADREKYLARLKTSSLTPDRTIHQVQRDAAVAKDQIR